MKKYKFGQVLSRGLIPCIDCNERHIETVIQINPMMTSWAADGGLGHSYREIPAREYIQIQRDEINRLLRKLRRYGSKAGKENNND